MKKFLGFHTSALIEMLTLLVIFTGASFLFGDGSRFLGISPHPFWIIILLMIVQYGTKEAILATFFSTLFLYTDNIPRQLVQESAFAYQFRLSLTPFLWFASSFVLGELRMRIQTRLEDAERERDTALEHASAITENYEVLKAMKENLESRLAGQIHTVAATYDSVKELESLEPVQILLRLDKVVISALNPAKFSVFACGPNGLEAMTSEGWEPDDPYRRRFTDKDALFQEVVTNQRILSVINKEDRKVLSEEGVMAAPLIDTNEGSVFGMLKIEEIDFFKIDIGNLETFSGLCSLIGTAYSNAVKYTNAVKNTIYDIDKGLFSHHLYQIMMNWAEAFARRTSTPLTNLTIQVFEPDKGSMEERKVAERILNEVFKENLPTKNQTPVFESKDHLLKFEIILPLTSVEQSEKLSLKLLNAIKERTELKPFTFHFQTMGVFDPQKQEGGVACD